MAGGGFILCIFTTFTVETISHTGHYINKFTLVGSSSKIILTSVQAIKISPFLENFIP